MAALKETETVGLLTDAGSRLLDPPSSQEELLKLLAKLEIILYKMGQDPSAAIQKALLPSMRALISDRILKNSDPHIKMTVTVCFNELMRITAPDSPYDDNRMKEIFELTVSSFEKLSHLSCASYPKALLIIENAAKIRSCVMMLDIGCDKLIIEMFEHFKRNLRSDHPPIVFFAMETIMSDIIDESEDIPLELLKVLLDCVCKEKENTSPMAWRLGAKVMEKTCQKLKPFLRDAIKSGDIKKDDYSPVIDSVLQADSETLEQKHAADPTKELVAKDSLADASTPRDASKSVDAPAINLTVDIRIKPEDLIANQTPSKALGDSYQSKASDNAGMKTETHRENERTFHIGSSSKRPRGRPRKSIPVAFKPNNTSKDVLPTRENDMLTISEEKKHPEASVNSSFSGKKAGRPRKDTAGGSVNKIPFKPSHSGKKLGRPRKDVTGYVQKWRSLAEIEKDLQKEEGFQTPFGLKKYKEDIVGCRLKVWWPEDLAFYEGRLTAYDKITGKHRVDYEDGDTEMLTLLNEHFEFIGDEIAERKIEAKPLVSSADKANEDPKDTGTPKDASKDIIAA